MIKKLNKIKKILAIIFLMLITLSTVQPVFAVSGTGEFVGGQYDSGIKTTDNQNTGKGVMIRRLINYSTGEKMTTFCAEYSVTFKSGVIYDGRYYTPTDSTIKRACKVAYFGWYSKYPDYVIDGGILATDMKWVKQDYVFTQQYIWETLGQSNATFIDETVQGDYILFKNDVNSKIEKMQKKPSFSDTAITVDIGETLTLTDINNVLADYTSIDKTYDGIRIVHNKGENTMTITVGNDCSLENYNISEEMMKNWGLIKEETKDNDTTVYFSFEEEIQNQFYAMNYNDPVTMSMNLQINLLGKIELTKLDKEGKLIDGAIFEIKGPDNFSKDVIVTNGKITIDNLKKGIYTIKEKNSPNGYLLNNNTYTVEVFANQTTTQAIINETPTGTIKIMKKDSETGSIPQGDATLENAVYNVYANDDIYDVAKTKKIYSKGDLVATRITNVKGETEDVTNLPLGRYLVKEEKTPIGYMIDRTEYEVNLIYKDQYTKIITGSVTSTDQVKKMQVHIYKTAIKENSGLVAGLAGAEFTIKLYSDVEKAYVQGYSYEEIWGGIDEFGNTVNVDKNRVAEAQKIAPSYEIIVTDVNGNGYTQEKLPYGKYIVKETKIPQNFKGAEDFTFSITQDESEIQEIGQKVKYLVVNNEQLQTYIKLIKKDLKTGKTVTLSSSTFEIKATEDIVDITTGEILYPKGQVITQKIGNTFCSSFTTNADNIVVPENSYNSGNDDRGSVTTPLLLPAGSYEITEIKVPEGFLQLEQPINFQIEDIKNLDKNQNGDFIMEVIIKNEQPTGSLIVNKNIVTRENVDTSLIDISDLSGIQFKLTAKEDVIDFADGSVIYKKGQKVNIYNLDQNGNLKVENLPMGTYELQEIKTLDRLVLDDAKYEVKFTQKDKVTKVYTETKEIVNNSTIIEISKIGITGEKQIVGAKLTVIDENDRVIDTWISTENTHKIEGLIVGKTYTLIEIISPYGYEIAEPITFKVTTDKETQIIEMKDMLILKTIEVVKVDSETKEIIKSNFKFGIYEDFECTKLIKEIESDKQNGTVVFDGLKYGTYYIKELKAPNGYQLSSKIIKIEINDKGTFADGELLEDNNSICTVTYYNQLIPIIQTGNERNYTLLFSSLLISLSGLMFLISKK